MKTEIWRDCIVTYIDVVGIKKIARRGDSKASSLMLKLHSLAQTSMDEMPYHAHSYCWNDSVLLLAFWDKKAISGHCILGEINNLKRRIDKDIKESYAISVKGQAFPDRTPIDCNGNNRNLRCTVLKASSYAMANCFEIESEAKKRKLRASWYVDSWLKKALNKPFAESFQVKMLPTGNERDIFLFNDYLSEM